MLKKEIKKAIKVHGFKGVADVLIHLSDASWDEIGNKRNTMADTATWGHLTSMFKRIYNNLPHR